ncbi:putative NRPS-like protein biosynthetic cluster [Recurvomyces mirabilis]|uniref:NRPS-like protein biosynthetic cluster n=1 Tax=Recurvomyces mirabilis TaxID=574656 RepID=A0AAE0TP35_9PEZI|nr:putative NRPS-like protein biosynthetic cluster [Recurvomyces mirabilis]KAK5156121.1 hypothetical protein LTS14_005008 [Recurvomyces mirabilis]
MATTTTTRSSKTSISLTSPVEDHTPKASIFSHAAYPTIENFKTIDGLLKSHAQQKDQKPLICYPKSDVDDFEEHTAIDLDRYTDATVAFYMDSGLSPADPTQEKAPVISLLATSSFEVILTKFALNRLGYAVLFLSTRLTAPAYARLMEMCESRTIVTSEKFTPMIADIENDRPGCTGVTLLQRNDWHGRQSATPLINDEKWHECQSKKIAWILHSSGSTGFPKPIYLSNLQCLANFRKSFGMRAFTASPLFHSGGLMELGRAFYTRSPMFLANHSLPVTSTNMLRAISAAKPRLVVAVPYVLKLLAEKKEGIDALAATDLVLFNGSGCPDDLGDRLVDAGVNLVANYGATETGQLMTSFRGLPPTDREWSYLRLWPPVKDFSLMDEIAPGVFEAVGLDGLPSKGAVNSDDPPNSFRTADLFTRHSDPSKNNFYKYLSRADDRITLVMGEKVLPLPMEGRIRQEDIVREAVVFGFQQTIPGVLIFRPADKATDLSGQDYLDAVWPAVEAASARAESFARIIKEMVVIMPASADYAKTDKGTFIRAQVYQQFDAEIQAAYARLESSSQGVEKLALEVPELEQWLMSRFCDDLRIPIKDVESDIFAAGVDSLQTTRIWRAIRQKLELGSGGASMSTNVVFECGTVSRLARYLFALRTGGPLDDDDGEVKEMRRLIEMYSAFHQRQSSTKSLLDASRHTVLLTGATGNLGAFILADLLRRGEVKEIIVLARASSHETAKQRIKQSLTDRKIGLTPEQEERIRPLACDLSQPDLALPVPHLEHILESVTCTIHSAWAVNFNLGVRSFEDQHIRGTFNLINLCIRSHLSQPASFFFCSSVSTASSTPKPATIPERIIEDLSHAQKTGYGRSKMVAEHITAKAMQNTGMRARVLRIGQLSGDTKAGIWNDTEAIPLMLRSAITTGVLPAVDEKPSWLSVDVCAEAVTEISLAGGGMAVEDEAKLVYHILNPRTFSWRDDLLPALRRLQEKGEYTHFDIASPSEWLEKLASSEQDPEKNPSIKLLDFWRGKYGNALAPVEDEDAPGLTFETSKTVEKCKVLVEVRDPVSEGLMEKYVLAWMRRWKV